MDTATVNWDFVVLFGTILFWGLLHLFSPDGRQWRTDAEARGLPPADPVLDEAASSRAPRS